MNGWDEVFVGNGGGADAADPKPVCCVEEKGSAETAVEEDAFAEEGVVTEERDTFFNVLLFCARKEASARGVDDPPEASMSFNWCT